MAMFTGSGCSVNRQEINTDFVEHYQKIIDSSDNQSFLSDNDNDKVVTLSVDSMPLSSFIRALAQQCNVSIVSEQNLDSKPVSVDVTAQPVSEVLSVVARRLGVSLTRSGDLFYLGEIRPEDRGVYVRKVKRALASDLRTTIEILRSENGRGVVYDDGLVVVGDRVELLRSLDEMFNQIENSPVGSWCVQLFVLSVADSMFSEIGLDSYVSADMSYNIVKAGSSVDSSLAVSGALSGLLRADKGDGRIESVTRPTFLIQDGSEGYYLSGQVFKLPTKSVSDSGTVTTTGYENFDVGLKILCKLVDYGSDRVQISVDLTNSSVVGYSEEGYPNISSDEFRCSSVVNSGQTLLLGSFVSDGSDQSVQGLFNMFKSSKSSKREFLIWARCYRVL